MSYEKDTNHSKIGLGEDGEGIRVWGEQVEGKSLGKQKTGCFENSLETKLIKQPTCPFNIINLPVLFFLFPGSCAFQNVLLYLGRCAVLGSGNYLGLSKVAVPKSKTNFYKITFTINKLRV